MTFQLPGTPFKLNRMGFGAMRLAGPGVYGPPTNETEALEVLQTAVELGVNHIDTSDFYGPHVVNQLIRRALEPYKPGLVIVTKIGYKRLPDKSWVPAFTPLEIKKGINDNLANLGLESLDVVNLRLSKNEGPDARTVEQALRTLLELKEQGFIKHIGVSNCTREQFQFVRQMTPIVCVQNEYNIVNRHDDAFIDELNAQGIAYVPYFPLGGFTPVQSHVLDECARDVGATPMQVALAWLLQRSPNILLIPGTSSVEHLRENLRAQLLKLPASVAARLNSLAR